MKSTNSERIKRINAAIGLLEKLSVAKAAVEMTERYGISKRQAYRYINDAKTIGQQIPIPDRKIAFTVKLSKNLALRTKEYAVSIEKTISEVVTQSLETYLQFFLVCMHPYSFTI